jgi:hypothetical protein
MTSGDVFSPHEPGNEGTPLPRPSPLGGRGGPALYLGGSAGPMRELQAHARAEYDDEKECQEQPGNNPSPIARDCGGRC